MPSKKIVFLPFFIILVLSGFQLSAYGSTAVEKSSDLGIALENMAKLQGFSCKFRQVLSYAEGGERIYEGDMAVLRPGKFRWRYLKPYEQLYVSNGKGIWLYEPDLMQAQLMQDLGEVEPVVLQLLDGRVGLQDVHILGQEVLATEVSWHLRIGAEDNAADVFVGISNRALSWIRSVDVLANKNTLYLLQLKKVKPTAEIFEFVAPEGVDVIGALQ